MILFKVTRVIQSIVYSVAMFMLTQSKLTFGNIPTLESYLSNFSSVADLDCDKKVDISDMIKFVSCLLSQSNEERSCLNRVLLCDELENTPALELVDFNQNKVSDYFESSFTTQCLSHQDCTGHDFCNLYGFCQKIDCSDQEICKNSNLCAHVLCDNYDQAQECYGENCDDLCTKVTYNHTRQSALKINLGSSAVDAICSKYEKDYFEIQESPNLNLCDIKIFLKNESEDSHLKIEVYDFFGKNLESFREISPFTKSFRISMNLNSQLSFPLYAQVSTSDAKKSKAYLIETSVICE